MDNIVWLVVAIILILGFVSLAEGNGKNKVIKILETKGFQQIKVKTKLFTGSQGTVTFDVEYQDNNGVLQNNSCVMHTSLFSDEKIYWEKPLE